MMYGQRACMLELGIQSFRKRPFLLGTHGITRCDNECVASGVETHAGCSMHDHTRVVRVPMVMRHGTESMTHPNRMRETTDG